MISYLVAVKSLIRISIFIGVALLLQGCFSVYNHSHLQADNAVYFLDGGSITVSADPSGGGARTHPPWALTFTLVMDRKSAEKFEISKIEVEVDGQNYKFEGNLIGFISNSGFAQVKTSNFIPKPKFGSSDLIVNYSVRISGNNKIINRTVRFVQKPSKGIKNINPLFDVS